MAKIFKQSERKHRLRVSRLAIVLVTAMSAGAVQSETLADALAGAYENSGLLEQNRALLRAADEDVATAGAALKPILQYTASVSRDIGRASSSNALGPVSTGLESSDASIGLVASMLLYDGGASKLSVEALKETVLATRQQLVSVEQSVLLRAVAAFLSVRSAAEFVQLRQNNLRLLTQELRAAQDRFEVGEVTRTDVAQAESSLAEARSGLATAQGDLQQAIEEYRAAVGRAPGNLAPPPSLPRLESNIEVARSRAVQSHPDLLAVQHQVSAAELGIMQAKAEFNPTISATGRFGYSDNLGSSDFSNLTTLGVELSGPIYQGGALSASVRRAIAVRDAQRGNLLTVQRRIVQDVGNAYAALSARRASLAASEERIRAARIAFRGVREEATLGARTTLDVLDAEQELLDAETARISDQANLYVAAYAVLQATGQLTADKLNLGVQLYDPAAYYNLVKDSPAAFSEQGRRLDKVLKSLQRE